MQRMAFSFEQSVCGALYRENTFMFGSNNVSPPIDNAHNIDFIMDKIDSFAFLEENSGKLAITNTHRHEKRHGSIVAARPERSVESCCFAHTRDEIATRR